MFKKLLGLKRRNRTIGCFDPMDFSHAVFLKIIIKKDGSKLYHPFGLTNKAGTPITTIEYEQ